MTRILALKSSLNGANSRSNGLIDSFLAQRRANGYTDQVVERDLADIDLPVLDAELFHALRGAQSPNDRVSDAIALSDKLIDELKACELILIGAPMYNLNVPTPLKNWFDLIARAQVTFRYTDTYPEGLIHGVRAVVFSSRGGVHAGQATDAVTPYLRSVLGLIGVTDVSFVYAEGMDIRPHGIAAGMNEAATQIAQFAGH
ncbi:MULTISPECIES: NAD(P)H-dependent oxidoreductase [Stenotrophomonas]|uniref:FMN-dependent NADH-azoreductase n=1 Tax=Stenotrophomonas TaxID=40323 RepID=UPI00077053B8|nr:MULTISPECIES: NAD(P)H-dependent oxidoreductase [Stenotrophomonas]AMJ56594.1 FMN-dependent NADH-azoreductase [Stenotrophomonas sp. KCTC 12332]